MSTFLSTRQMAVAIARIQSVATHIDLETEFCAACDYSGHCDMLTVTVSSTDQTPGDKIIDARLWAGTKPGELTATAQQFEALEVALWEALSGNLKPLVVTDCSLYPAIAQVAA